jgi:hypothetical protein
MSPQAAAWLDSIGFEQVYDYTAGKVDWGSFGLPLEGTEGSETRVGAHVRSDVPSCRSDDRLQDVCERLDETGCDTCFVLDEVGVVLAGSGVARSATERTSRPSRR